MFNTNSIDKLIFPNYLFIDCSIKFWIFF